MKEQVLKIAVYDLPDGRKIANLTRPGRANFRGYAGTGKNADEAIQDLMISYLNSRGALVMRK